MTDIEQLLRELKAEVVAMRTDMILVKFAVEKMERQIQDLHDEIVLPKTRSQHGGSYHSF